MARRQSVCQFQENKCFVINAKIALKKSVEIYNAETLVFRYYTKAMLNEMTPKIEAVQKMQDYIAAHQTEEINLTRQITALRTLLYPKKHCIR